MRPEQRLSYAVETGSRTIYCCTNDNCRIVVFHGNSLAGETARNCPQCKEPGIWSHQKEVRVIPNGAEKGW